ncbi:methyltransferase domain-containing protein [Haladaptatus sp. SPP-AMP-3]|uniref:class I SAM-dependent methyltransferase n=1 Tax=Haladaptatus sp. SPP-AMP-3 TaxID=3121295 RepID=UPI003C2B5405
MNQPSKEKANNWDTTTYDEGHSFVFEFGEGVVDLLEPEAGEQIIDLGCGTGHLSHRIADAGANVIGLDASEEMITKARETYPECDFVHADARDFSFAEPFDSVFSNAALHWIPEQDAVLESITNVLQPNGQFVAELGGIGNIASIVETVQDVAAERGYEVKSPWYFPTVGEYTTKLEAHGFEVRYATLFDRPTELDGGTDGLSSWLRMFGDSLLAPIPDEEQQGIISTVEDRLRGRQFIDGTWVADYRRLRIVAVYMAE